MSKVDKNLLEAIDIFFYFCFRRKKEIKNESWERFSHYKLSVVMLNKIFIFLYVLAVLSLNCSKFCNFFMVSLTLCLYTEESEDADKKKEGSIDRGKLGFIWYVFC